MNRMGRVYESWHKQSIPFFFSNILNKTKKITEALNSSLNLVNLLVFDKMKTLLFNV